MSLLFFVWYCYSEQIQFDLNCELGGIICYCVWLCKWFWMCACSSLNNIPYYLFLLKLNSRQSQRSEFVPFLNVINNSSPLVPPDYLKKKIYIQTKRRRKNFNKSLSHDVIFWYSAHIHDWVSIYSDNNRWFVKMMNDTVQQSRCPPLHLLNSYINRRSI